MRHRNSVFHDVLKLVPWAAFDRLVDEHGTDEGARQLHDAASLQCAFVRPVERRRARCARSKRRWRAIRGGSIIAARSHRSVRPSPTPTATGIPASFPACSRHAGASQTRFPPQDGRRGAPDQLDRPASCRRRRAMGALLDRRVRRQGACRLRSRPRPPGLSRGDGRQRQRHHRRQGDADRTGRDLCLRSRLLRLRLVGAARRAQAAVW